MDRNNWLITHIDKIVTIMALLITGIFWIFTMNGIPARVTKLEEDVSSMKTQLTKNDTKTDIILEDTKFIKQLIIQNHQ